jgi:hypothetical protein
MKPRNIRGQGIANNRNLNDYYHKFDVHDSVHRETTIKNNQQDALCRLIYYFKSALHVSGDVFLHNQEPLIVFTVSGSVHTSCCRVVSRKR